MPAPALLALDFDGVLSDSAPESFLVALRTWDALKPGSKLAAVAAGCGPGIPSRDAVAACPAYGPFLQAMPLGNRAEDFGVVLSAIASERHLPDQEAYDALCAEHDPDWLRTFHRRFYRERTALAEADTAAWLGLMGPYDAMVDLLCRRAGDVELAIATAKDRRSVRALLGAYGLDDLFDDEHLLDKETGASKVAHLRALAERFGQPFERICFVDDKVNHLDRVAPLGVRCALAAWGYNGPREVQLARSRGYLVCSLEDAERQLFGNG